MLSSFWVTRNIIDLFSIAFSRAAMDFFLPTTRGATIPGKMTMSRRGIRGYLFAVDSLMLDSGAFLGLLAFIQNNRILTVGDDLFIDDAFRHILLGGEFEHDLKHCLFHDRTQPPGAGLPFQGLG